MIREFAFGLNKRHYFQDSTKMGNWQGVNKDTFVSLYAYDEEIKDYFKINNTLAGYNGKIFLPKEYILDVDGENSGLAHDKTMGLSGILDNLNIPWNAYFSGRGFHLGIPDEAFKWKPSDDLHIRVRNALNKHHIYNYADSSVTDKTRLIRLNNTRNLKSGLWKIFITQKELHTLDIEEIIELAEKPRYDKIPIIYECEPVIDTLKRMDKKIIKDLRTNEQGDPSFYPCIQKMLNGVSYGSRHKNALVLASHFRKRMPEDMVRNLMESWRAKVDLPNHPFPEKEMDSLIISCYKSNNGEGYNYGCDNPIKDAFCSATCRLYKAKKSQNLMDAASIEKQMTDFYNSNIKPLPLGEMYNRTFDVYPGELIVIQAPPASMKTTLLQNWVNYFKRPTYFLEMEMSVRQIWTRFLMIEKGWTEIQVQEHYSNKKNGIGDQFKWLYVDTNPCYPFELEKRISMMPYTPEILVIDHLGLMQTKHRDNNMKLEEATQSLTDIAIKYNLVVFTVSEITKQAYYDGMNIASGRGSFRIAYNASKVFSLIPEQNTDTKVINNLNIRTEKNRERGSLDIKLEVNNLQIGLPKVNLTGKF